MALATRAQRQLVTDSEVDSARLRPRPGGASVPPGRASRSGGTGQARSESATVAVTDRGSEDAVLRCRRFRRRPAGHWPAAATAAGPPL
jgi:hypothetical protein